MDTTGHARITDIGLAQITQDLDAIRSTSADHDYHCMRWIAPEILDDQRIYSAEADIFSFAGLAIEVRCR